MNSSKSLILEALGELKAPSENVASFYQNIQHIKYPNPLEKFIDLAKASGAKIFYERPNTFQSIFENVKVVVDTTTTLEKDIEIKSLQEVDLTILDAKFGVAENGAVWIEWKDTLFPRSLLTLSKNLAIYLKRDAILNNMSEAYKKIDFSKVSYGIFVSGPSKTADIEQSLVIGAHGAVNVGIFLI
jgi:L-lactate dehydrogenase complex protein LldG